MDITQEDLAAAQEMLDEMLMEELTEDQLALPISSVVYPSNLGFKPARLATVLKQRAKERKIKPEDHQQNLNTLAAVGSLKGSNVKKIMEKGSREIKTWLADKINVYKIINTKPTSNSDVTLPRIAAMYVGKIVINVNKGIWSMQPTILPSSIAENFPAGMCISNFGLIIPRSILIKADRKLLMGACSYHQYRFDAVINSGNHRKTTLKDIYKYVKIQRDSELYTDEQRVTILKKAGIIDSNCETSTHIVEKYKKSIATANEEWLKLGNQEDLSD